MSRAHRVSGSRVGLTMACAHQARVDLPEVPRVESAAATGGNVEHGHIEHTIETGDETPQSATHAVWLDGWWVANKNHGWIAERAFAFSPSTGLARMLPRSTHRDYSSVEGDEIPLTVDAFRVSDDSIEVVDWKTGAGFSVEPAATNWQLRTAAVALAAIFTKSSARVAIVKANGDRLYEDSATIDGLDLFTSRMTLSQMVGSIAEAQPVAGPHCRSGYCERFGLCAATRVGAEMVASQRQPAFPLVSSAGEIQSAEHATWLYHLARALEATKSAVFAALTQYADGNGGIDVGGGKSWTRVEFERESIDLTVPGAVDALRSALGSHADVALEMSTSKAAIKEAARALKAAEGTPLAQTERAALAALASVGAVRTTMSQRYEERPVRKEMSAQAAE